uniref:Uncharacterized protein n=1 Tax=Caenorhabditis japonica TaxID=281687 RepID=A0A8R1E5A0_CAEJA
MRNITYQNLRGDDVPVVLHRPVAKGPRLSATFFRSEIGPAVDSSLTRAPTLPYHCDRPDIPSNHLAPTPKMKLATTDPCPVSPYRHRRVCLPTSF